MKTTLKSVENLLWQQLIFHFQRILASHDTVPLIVNYNDNIIVIFPNITPLLSKHSFPLVAMSSLNYVFLW
jgi:hypothetical protein